MVEVCRPTTKARRLPGSHSTRMCERGGQFWRTLLQRRSSGISAQTARRTARTGGALHLWKRRRRGWLSATMPRGRLATPCHQYGWKSGKRALFVATSLSNWCTTLEGQARRHPRPQWKVRHAQCVDLSCVGAKRKHRVRFAKESPWHCRGAHMRAVFKDFSRHRCRKLL